MTTADAIAGHAAATNEIFAAFRISTQSDPSAAADAVEANQGV